MDAGATHARPEEGVDMADILVAPSVADPKDDRPQLDKFKDLARELEADEDEAGF
jgi:hypothetical protein